MKAAIVGANGYGGIELIRLLLRHPYVELEMLVSHATQGQNIEELYPHLTGIVSKKLEPFNAEVMAARVDVVFFATPSGVSKMLLPQCVEKGLLCIDLSGDFRLRQPGDYEAWYQLKPARAEWLEQSVYGLSEVNRQAITEAKWIANPGCYPTAALLGLIPAIKEQAIALDSIIIDGKSGVSGSGRQALVDYSYTELNENVKAYKLGAHRHTPEIEQALSDVSGEPVHVTFSPHLIPMTRGLMCTIYATMTKGYSTSEWLALYETFYRKSPFVRVSPLGRWPSTKEVIGSNYCDIGLCADGRTRRLMIVSVIDNLVKGAAGQAIQNLNLIKGWDEEAGLSLSPTYL
ncbi:MAG: N-acetyl-gamma-glutamyl-phosphate reductase [Sporolactobacillus sp.]